MRTLEEITTVVLHCSDTPNSSDRWGIDDIDDWHASRGFKRDDVFRQGSHRHVGYHKVIHVDGSTHLGRTLEEEGAHCKGLNGCSVGICLMGSTAFSRAAWTSLRAEIVILTEILGRPLAVVGHRDYSDKDCPGFDTHLFLVGGMAPLPDHLIP